MLLSHIRDELRRSMQAFGLRRTLADVGLRALNRVVSLQLIQGVLLEPGPALQSEPDKGYRFCKFDKETLLPFAQTQEHELSELFLSEAFARGDVCYGFLHGAELAAFTFVTNLPTQDAQVYDPQRALSCLPREGPGLIVHFDDQYSYLYKGFTHPRHRGHRLHRLGVALSLVAELARGKRGLVSYVGLTDFAARGSATLAGFSEFGTLAALRVLGRELVIATTGCKPYQFRVEWAAPLATEPKPAGEPSAAAHAWPPRARARWRATAAAASSLIDVIYGE
jgi:hypothetical protein